MTLVENVVLFWCVQVLHVVSSGGQGGSVLSGAPAVLVPDFSTVVREDASPHTDTLKRGGQRGVSTTVRLAAKTVSRTTEYDFLALG